MRNKEFWEELNDTSFTSMLNLYNEISKYYKLIIGVKKSHNPLEIYYKLLKIGAKNPKHIHVVFVSAYNPVQVVTSLNCLELVSFECNLVMKGITIFQVMFCGLLI
jgi:hypothetical protein